MNEAWAGRHILPFVTETFFVHKTNGENQWKQMAQGNGRKETNLLRTQRNDGQTRAGNTGLFRDFNWLCGWSDEEKAWGLNTGTLLPCSSLCTSQAS